MMFLFTVDAAFDFAIIASLLEITLEFISKDSR